MTVVKKTNVYRTVPSGRAVYVGLSVADGITGGRWHTDGPGIGSGAKGPAGEQVQKMDQAVWGQTKA